MQSKTLRYPPEVYNDILEKMAKEARLYNDRFISMSKAKWIASYDRRFINKRIRRFNNKEQARIISEMHNNNMIRVIRCSRVEILNKGPGF